MAEVKTGIEHVLERDTRKGGGRHFHFFITFQSLIGQINPL
jgi:hypothetical protein